MGGLEWLRGQARLGWFLLALLPFTGCAARQVAFSSDIPADLLLDGAPCALPCTLTPQGGMRQVLVRAADGRERLVSLPEAPGVGTRAGKLSARLLGNTLQFIAYPLFSIGLLSLAASTDSNDDLSAGEISSNNDTSQLELLGYAGIFSGWLCLEGGEALVDLGRLSKEEVYVEFGVGPSVNGLSEQPGRYPGLDDRFLLPLPGEQGSGEEGGGQPSD